MKKLNKKGFTIVELVIVIAVIAILAAVLIPTFSGVVDKANKSADQQAARNAYVQYVAEQDANDIGDIQAAKYVYLGGNYAVIVEDEQTGEALDDNKLTTANKVSNEAKAIDSVAADNFITFNTSVEDTAKTLQTAGNYYIQAAKDSNLYIKVTVTVADSTASWKYAVD